MLPADAPLRPLRVTALQEVNKVQLDIRTGHAQTVDKVINWLTTDGALEGTTVCDVRARASRRCAGCHALRRVACVRGVCTRR